VGYATGVSPFTIKQPRSRHCRGRNVTGDGLSQTRRGTLFLDEGARWATPVERHRIQLGPGRNRCQRSSAV